MENNSQTFIHTEPTGFVKPTYAYRNLTIYGVQESELITLTLINTDSIMFFSLGSFFISSTIAILLGGIFADHLQNNSMGKFLFYWGAPVLLVMALIFFFLGWFSICKKNKLIDNIKKESPIPR